MKTKYLFTLFYLSILIISCETSKKITTPNDTEQTYVSKPNPYFPLQIGNSWIYNGDNGTEITIIEKIIVDTLRHTDGTLLYTYREGLLGFPNNDYLEFYYGNREGNILWYSGSTDTSEDSQGTLFPTVKREFIIDSLFVGQEWITYDFPNSGQHIFKVLSQGDLEVNGVLYSNVFMVTHNSDSLYYAKDIGLIKSSTLKLKSYTIQN